MKKIGSWAKEKVRSLKTSFPTLPSNRKFLWIFAGISVFSVVWYLLYIYLFFSWGKNLVGPNFLHGSLFFQDVGDVFMDFFNINDMVWKNDPYFVEGEVGEGSSYPPLILLFAKLFSLIGGTAETPRGIRVTFRGIVSLILYFAIFIGGTVLLLKAYGKKVGFTKNETTLLTVSLFLTAPMLYLIDRGNYLTFTLLALGVFFLFSEETGGKKELSYLALAIAVAFKLYPAFFALLLLAKKDFWGFGKTVLYSVVLLIVPFFFFEHGIMNVRYFLENLFKFTSEPYSFWAEGVRYMTGMSNDLAIDNAVKVVYLFLTGSSAFDLPLWVGAFALGVRIGFAFLTVGGVFFAKEKWGAVLSASAAILILPSPSFAYTACVMLFPLLFFLAREREEKGNKTYFVLLVLSLIVLDLGFMLPTWSHGLQHGYATINFIEVVAVAMLSTRIFGEGLAQRLKEKS